MGPALLPAWKDLTLPGHCSCCLKGGLGDAGERRPSPWLPAPWLLVFFSTDSQGYCGPGRKCPFHCIIRSLPAQGPNPKPGRVGSRLFIPQGYPESLGQAGEGKGDTALDPGSWKRPKEVNRG